MHAYVALRFDDSPRMQVCWAQGLEFGDFVFTATSGLCMIWPNRSEYHDRDLDTACCSKSERKSSLHERAWNFCLYFQPFRIYSISFVCFQSLLHLYKFLLPLLRPIPCKVSRTSEPHWTLASSSNGNKSTKVVSANCFRCQSCCLNVLEHICQRFPIARATNRKLLSCEMNSFSRFKELTWSQPDTMQILVHHEETQPINTHIRKHARPSQVLHCSKMRATNRQNILRGFNDR